MGELKGSMVLVVDDDIDALKVLEAALRRHGYEVMTAQTGAEALSLVYAHAEEIDAILLDLMMPGGIDGYDVCRRLADRDCAAADIPIIVVSARSSPMDMEKSFASGAIHHISKPYDIAFLFAVLESTIRVKNIQDHARENADKYAAIFENSPLGVVVLDKKYAVLEMNQVMREVFPKVIPGSGVKEHQAFYDPPLASTLPEHPLTATLESGLIRQACLRIEQAGELIWRDISTAPLKDKRGHITGAIMIVKDVTRERMIAQQLQDEIEHSRRAEEQRRIEVERHKAALQRMDQMHEHLINTQKDLRRHRSELEDANKRLEEVNKMLEVLSTVDDLTKLYNRRYFNQIFQVESHRASRYGHSLAVLMMDIDHFKRINDTHGHQAGDEVLRIVGAILRHELRESDIVARYGGEEFVAVLPETSRDDAYKIAERIRASVATGIFAAGDENLSVTISIGVTTGHGEALDPEILISDADSALYKAKEGGRNRVVMVDF